MPASCMPLPCSDHDAVVLGKPNLTVIVLASLCNKQGFCKALWQGLRAIMLQHVPACDAMHMVVREAVTPGAPPCVARDNMQHPVLCGSQ